MQQQRREDTTIVRSRSELLRHPALAGLLAAVLMAPGLARAEEAQELSVEERRLYVAPEDAPEARRAFVEALASHRGGFYELYDSWIERVGANGILDGIDELYAGCHSEAHDLGKVVHARLGSIGDSLRSCDRRCHSGCMHGVLMSAFTEMCTVDGRLHLDLLAPSIELVCMAEPQMQADYDQGDCAHGVGHALMFLADYSVPVAVAACTGFGDEVMRYYCATGAYMEFVTDGRADADIEQRRFFPCDSHPYPAACARYLMPRLLGYELQKNGSAYGLFELCRGQEGHRRIGCYHGLGNALAALVVRGAVSIETACGELPPDEQQVCIDGVIERLARYHPTRAAEICSELEDEPRQVCERAIRGGMYRMDRDRRLYTGEGNAERGATSGPDS